MLFMPQNKRFLFLYSLSIDKFYLLNILLVFINMKSIRIILCNSINMLFPIYDVLYVQCRRILVYYLQEGIISHK